MTKCHGSRRPGFTLIEVVVSLVISVIVLLGARAILGEMSDDTRKILDDARSGDESANAERTLRSAARQLDVADGTGTEFGGDSMQMNFASWCDGPRGGLQRCELRMSIETDSVVKKLLLSGIPGGPIVIRRGFQRGALRYLDSPANGGVWIATWAKGITAPLAFGIIVDFDTLIVRVGERG